MNRSFAQAYPKIAREWHPTRNGRLRPDQIGPGKGGKFWWRCQVAADHEWEATLNNRIQRGSGCPCCANLKASVTNSLATVRPDLAAEWHPSENGALRPDQIVAGSEKKVWWRCPAGPDHEWTMCVRDRTAGRGCPFCSGRRASVTNSLASVAPEVAAQWHPTRNGRLQPSEVSASSTRRAWWRCPQGPDHEWQAIIRSRSLQGNGCPFCAGQKVSVTNSLASRFSELAAQWHPTRNRSPGPDSQLAGSTKTAWWRCPLDPDHEWQAAPATRIKGTGCPYCTGQKVSAASSLAARYPEIAAEWHPTRNGRLRPDQVVPGSGKLVWWKCLGGPDHEWRTAIGFRTALGRTDCPCCSGKKLSVTNCLATVLPDVAAQWHPTRNGSLTPEQVTSGSARRVWWRCPNDPTHDWQTSVSQRRKGTGCPVCARRNISPRGSLQERFPEIAAQWHPERNSGLTPDQVTTGMHLRVWWRCVRGADHEWRATINARTCGNGCPFCAGKRVSVTNSLASLYPQIAAEWHPTKNSGRQPESVQARSNTKVWWQCGVAPDHEWQVPVRQRTVPLRPDLCPHCVAARQDVARARPQATVQGPASRIPRAAAHAARV